MSQIKISTIQIKRGTHENLIAVLKGDKMLKEGEMAYELPTDSEPAGRLVIGTGDTSWVDEDDHSKGQRGDYINLPYQATVSQMTQIYDACNEAKNDASNSAGQAANSEINASRDAEYVETIYNEVHDLPERSVQAVDNYMNNKIKFMTVSEYNELTHLEAGCLYFLKADGVVYNDNEG